MKQPGSAVPILIMLLALVVIWYVAAVLLNWSGVTDAIKLAVIRAREADVQARAEKLAKMQAVVDEVSTWPRTGLKADKAFFDSLNDE